MPLKLLVPVLPSDRFYDAVVAAGDIVAREGGTVTFLFTQTRPPPEWEEREDSGFDLNLGPEAADEDEADSWQQRMIEGMGDATDLLLERGIEEGRVTYVFADEDLALPEAIAGEAAAGGFDMVVLPRGALANLPEGQPAQDIAAAVQELSGEGVKLLVT